MRKPEVTNNSPGWAVELTGDKIDLDDFRELLPRPFDPWIEDYPTDDGLPLLRSGSWANLTEADDVWRDATRMIERLNGEALLIHNDAEPVKLGRTIRFGPDGRPEFTIVRGTAHFPILPGKRVRRNTAAVTPKPAQGSRLQRWFREAETDDTRAELFARISRADNWYDLYKSAELARRLAGGSRAALKRILGSEDFKEWKRISQTANYYRHAPDPVKYPLPAQPAGFWEAKRILLKLIPRVL
jgi:hypothetical protein